MSTVLIVLIVLLCSIPGFFVVISISRLILSFDIIGKKVGQIVIPKGIKRLFSVVLIVLAFIFIGYFIFTMTVL